MKTTLLLFFLLAVIDTFGQDSICYKLNKLVASNQPKKRYILTDYSNKQYKLAFDFNKQTNSLFDARPTIVDTCYEFYYVRGKLQMVRYYYFQNKAIRPKRLRPLRFATYFFDNGKLVCSWGDIPASEESTIYLLRFSEELIKKSEVILENYLRTK